MMARVETWVGCDLDKAVQVRQLGGFLFTQDNEGNLLGAKVTQDGEPVDLTGTVVGYAILADGQTVDITGDSTGIQNGNEAFIILPQLAYSVPGQISIVIKLTTADTITTLAAFCGYVFRSKTGSEVVPPGTPIPDLSTLEEAIRNANTAATAANTAAAAAENVDISMSQDGDVITITTTDRQGETKTSTLTDQSEAVSELMSAISDSKNLTSELISGYYVNTNVAVGNTVDPTPVVNGGFSYLIKACNSGDVFTITSHGGTNPKAWCLTDSSYKVLAKASATAAFAETVAVQASGYMIVNNNTSNTNVAIIVKRLIQSQTLQTDIAANASDIDALETKVDELKNKNITHITDPHKLMWIMKSFTADGIGTSIYTDRMMTTCRVKAGSTIKTVSADGVKISFGYKVDDSQSTLDYYATYNYQDITVAQDCTIFIGCHRSPLSAEYNDSILNKITISLDVIDYESKYIKRDRVYGSPQLGHYIGQHTDSTGWTLTTNDPDDIITAFDALVTASNGLLTKTDLGTAYDTYHMYQYDTVPVGLHVGGAINVPKVAIICGQHGNEKMSTYAMYYLLYDMIHNPSKNLIPYYLRSNCRLSFIPIANPYGWINRTRLNENGVNLNRNWPTYNWDDYNDETSGMGGINYKGESAASETQTKLMIGFLRANYDAIFAIDLHTNGEDTSAWYEISTAVLNADSDTTGDDYKIQASYMMPSRLDISYIKSWMDENYGSDLGNVFYGDVTFPESDRPTAGQWIRESNNMVGITFEVLAGSSDSYLGSNLGKYSPATIKAAAEMLGDYLVAMIENSKSQT